MANALHPTSVALRQKLAKDRRMVSLIEREYLTHSPDIVFERENWVSAFVDYGHEVSFDRGRTRVCRAVNVRDGALFWMVRQQGKRLGYHAEGDDPLAAVEQAETAWAGRRAVRQNWAEVEALAADLLTGRRSFRVRVQDAFDSPLCSMGVRGFLASMRMSEDRDVSGRMAAMLMKIESQVGFVIHQAHLRVSAEQPVAEAIVPA